MKIAISSLGETLDDDVDERFGRAKYLLVADEETGDVVVFSNHENANALQGSGIGAAEAVVERGAGAVITGHLGPKAIRALDAAGIAGFDGSGMSGRAALAAFRAGTLARLSEAPSHSGM